MKTDVLYYGDNLKALAVLSTDSVDLVYADPPFFTGRDFGAFDDRWTIVNEYIDWLRIRLEACSRVLKVTGSIYVHCDWHADYRIRYILDKIFGVKQFQNEIIWCYRVGNVKRRFRRNHEIIFFYSKSQTYAFNIDSVRTPYSPKLLKHVKKDEDGDLYYLTGRTIRWNPYDAKGQKNSGRVYLHPNGQLPSDWWDDIPNFAKRRDPGGVAYPTQKPLLLLERIIKASSNPGDVVMDPFCGSGTALVAARNLGRHWIGVDNSEQAIETTVKRLGGECEVLDV